MIRSMIEGVVIYLQNFLRSFLFSVSLIFTENSCRMLSYSHFELVLAMTDSIYFVVNIYFTFPEIPAR